MRFSTPIPIGAFHCSKGAWEEPAKAQRCLSLSLFLSLSLLSLSLSLSMCLSLSLSLPLSLSLSLKREREKPESQAPARSTHPPRANPGSVKELWDTASELDHTSNQSVEI